MTQQKMERLAELRQKTAITVPPSFSISRALDIYLDKLIQIMMGFADREPATEATIGSLSSAASSGTRSIDFTGEAGGSLRYLNVSLDLNERVLTAVFVSTGKRTSKKSWKITTIQHTPVIKTAAKIWNTMVIPYIRP